MRPKNLATRLVISLLIAILVIFGVVMFFNFEVSKKLLIRSTRESVKQLSTSAVNKIEGNVLEKCRLAESTAQLILKAKTMNQEQLHGLIKELVDYNPDILGSAIALEPYSFSKNRRDYAFYYHSENDSLIYTDFANIGYDYYNQPWYKLPKEEHRAMFSEPYFDAVGAKQVVITYSLPLYKTNKKTKKQTFAGVLTIDLSLHWLNSLMDEMNFYENGYGFIVSSTGKFIVHPDTSYLIKEDLFSVAKKIQSPQMLEIGKKMLDGETGFAESTSAVLRRKSFIYYMPIPELNWRLGVIVPEKELFSEIITLYQLSVFIGIIGLLLFALFIVFLSKRITKPLNILAIKASEIGKGKFDTSIPLQKNSSVEVVQLADSLTMMQKELKQYIEELSQSLAKENQMKAELKVAEDIQQAIIPHRYPAFVNQPTFDVFGIVQPAKEIGGDLFDYFMVDEKHLCFLIGDVAGKGVPASLFMAITRTLFRTEMPMNRTLNNGFVDLPKVISDINNTMAADNVKTMFVTCFVGILNTETGLLSYCNAGHSAPYRRTKNGEISALPYSKNVALGVFEHIRFDVNTVELHSEDTLFFFTDGVTEAIAADLSFYTEHRLEKLLTTINQQQNAQELCWDIVNDVNAFAQNAEQADDITVLVLKYTENETRP